MNQKQAGYIYIVLNPVAGHSRSDDLQKLIAEQFTGAGRSYEIYETTGKEDITELTRQACRQGAGLVVAAGGDGTVSGVAAGLVGTDVPLGLLPVGTGNGLGRALGIPLEPEAAVQMLLGEHQLLPLDAMQVGDRYYVLNVSAGISSRAMRDTPVEEKRRLGMLAYARTILKDVFQARSCLFNLKLDGTSVRVNAAEVLVANGAVLKGPPFIFGARENYHDSQLEVNILTTRKATDYVRLAWDLLKDAQTGSSQLHDLTVHRHIVLDVAGRSLPVQADGELIGRTPVEIKLIPEALTVVAPLEEKDEMKGSKDEN